MRTMRALSPLILTGLVAAVLTVTAGCPRSGDVSDSGETPEPSASITKQPKPTPTSSEAVAPTKGALVITAEAAFYAYDDEGQWKLDSVLDLDDVAVAAAADDEALWIILRKEIVGFDNAFGKISTVPRFQPDEAMTAEAAPATVPFRRKAALYVSGGDAYVSEGSQFFVCQPGNLMEAATPLPKTAHDVFAVEGEAFLVDDIMRPLWIHRVDVSNLQRPKVTSRQEIKLINGHLGVQWVDLDANLWHVTTVSNHRTGMEVGLYSQPLDKGEAVSRTLWAIQRPGDTPVGDAVWEPQTFLWRVTKTKPFWGLARQGDAMKVVALGTDADPAAMTASWKVPGLASESTATGMAGSGKRLFVAVDRTLYVLDVSGGEPDLVARIALPALPVDVVVW